MNAYSKFPRRAFVIFVVLACGGWSSDNRANYENVNYIDDLFTHKVDGEGNTNAVQSGRRGKLILAERQSDKPKKMRKGTSNAPRLNKNRRQAGGNAAIGKDSGALCGFQKRICNGNESARQNQPCSAGSVPETNTYKCVDKATGRVLRERLEHYCCARNEEEPTPTEPEE
jgi:hypothetical protein